MKKIFYYTDVLPLLSEEGAAIKKLKDNLSIFKDSSGKVGLVWHPYPHTVKYMEINCSPVLDDYLRILDGYRTEGWGELDESVLLEDEKAALHDCDAYYGDMSDLVFEAQSLGMPVMLQNMDVLSERGE
ncbi:MAG: hypothetical protein K6C95_05485 [Lachnospiraceae bacterium]|nr:hypothetical protein [Lachnospiraceae bacterium]